jgi:hypothetical protein
MIPTLPQYRFVTQRLSLCSFSVKIDGNQIKPQLIFEATLIIR